MAPELPVAELIAGEALQPAAPVSLMAGAMGQALALSIDHVNTRQQFGRPLGKFQAVQQSLAVTACEVRAVDAAAAALAARLDATGRHASAAELASAAGREKVFQ